MSTPRPARSDSALSRRLVRSRLNSTYGFTHDAATADFGTRVQIRWWPGILCRTASSYVEVVCPCPGHKVGQKKLRKARTALHDVHPKVSQQVKVRQEAADVLHKLSWASDVHPCTFEASHVRTRSAQLTLIWYLSRTFSHSADSVAVPLFLGHPASFPSNWLVVHPNAETVPLQTGRLLTFSVPRTTWLHPTHGASHECLLY